MVVETMPKGRTWDECELCGLLLDTTDTAHHHEDNCDGEDPDDYQ
jgi:hypothetical protein